jgi:hypothetical protein
MSLIKGMSYVPLEEKQAAQPKFGDLLAGRSSNPSDDARVDRVKEIASELAEILKESYTTSDKNPVTSILFDQAVGAIVTAQMLVVKVITFKNPEDEVNGEKSTD